MAKVGKKRIAANEKFDAATFYSAEEAVTKVKECASANFDETVEAHFRLSIDTRQADQMVRGSISLPHGIGKDVRVAVFAEGDKAREAEAAGADLVGGDELIARVAEGFFDFDATVATPNMMAKVGRLGKILGPRSLMPNPKLGTVTMDVERIIKELKAGRIEYRADRFGICHVPVGKVSFDAVKLAENFEALRSEIVRVKPASSKGKYIKSVTLTSTMGPGIKIES